MTEQDFFRLTVNQMIEGLQVLSHDWVYLFVNDAAASHGARKKEELLGNKITDLYPGIEKTGVFEMMLSVRDSRIPKQIENHFEYPNGLKCWFELFIEPHPSGILIRSVDITKRKQIEAQYLQSQKMEAIGLLAGGISHDFNNKLGIMTLFGELALQQLEAGKADKVRTSLQSMLSAVQDSTRLTRQLLAFSRKQVLDPKVLSLNERVRDSQEALERLLGENIQLHLHLDPTAGHVQLDPAQIDQVILNLCLNARDAIKSSGHITIESSNVELDESYCAVHSNIIPGRYVLLTISDNGCGMDEDTRKRVFEPFFTTKSRDKGTGLGLASVYGVVHQSRGHILVYSEPGVGTTFKLYFPRVKADKESLPMENLTPQDVRGRETILLVEDDTLLRQAFQIALEGAGYKILAAESPESAIRLFEIHHQKIDLIFTDVIMPKMNGKELAQKLLEKKPTLKIIFVSGYTENSIVHNGILDTTSVLLQKPVTARNLLTTIRQVLDGQLSKALI